MALHESAGWIMTQIGRDRGSCFRLARSSAGRGKNFSTHTFGKRTDIFSHFPGNAGIKLIAGGRPSDQQHNPWMRSVLNQVTPLVCPPLESLWGDLRQRCRSFDTPRMRRQTKMAARDPDIGGIGGTAAFTTEQYQPGVSFALALNPARNTRGAPACGNDEIGPGWDKWVGTSDV